MISSKFGSLLKMRKDGVICLKINKFRCACGHGDMGTCTHQVLAATLPLPQPGGQNTSPSSYDQVDLSALLNMKKLLCMHVQNHTLTWDSTWIDTPWIPLLLSETPCT